MRLFPSAVPSIFHNNVVSREPTPLLNIDKICPIDPQQEPTIIKTNKPVIVSNVILRKPKNILLNDYVNTPGIDLYTEEVCDENLMDEQISLSESTSAETKVEFRSMSTQTYNEQVYDIDSLQEDSEAILYFTG